MSPPLLLIGIPSASGFGVAAALLVLGGAAFAFSYSPGPPRYTLTSGVLSIYDRLYPVELRSASVDVQNIRVVDLALEPGWRPSWRTDGFSNRHYYTGWFRLRSGTTARMYRASSQRLVLFPPQGSGAPVLIEVNDPDSFVEVVRKKWAA